MGSCGNPRTQAPHERYIYICIYIYTGTYIYIYTGTYIYIYTGTYESEGEKETNTHTHRYTNTQAHTHTHAHIHARTEKNDAFSQHIAASTSESPMSYKVVCAIESYAL